MNKKKSLERGFLLGLILTLLATFLGTPGSPSLAQAQQVGSQSYILQGSDVDQLARLVEGAGGRVTSRLEIIHGVAALLPLPEVDALRSAPGIVSLFENAPVQASDNGKGNGDVPASDYPEAVGADVLWDQGVTGSGVTVAILDTGLGRVPGIYQSAKGCPRDRVVGWKDFVEASKQPSDPNGHGTHVAGIIANTQMGEDGEWDGIAPCAGLLGVRVLDEKGAGTYEQVIQGIQWVVEHKDQYRVRVMNLSLVSPVQSPYWADPLNQAVMRAWAAGITVVAAAGNGGPGPMSVGVPGNNPYVITVGAFTDNHTPVDWNDDYIAPFSASGPTLDGFVKPDLVAPGAHIVSTIPPGSYISRNHEASRITPHYFEMAGTSQAAAVVSGVSALILSTHPELTPAQVKQRLLVTAFPWVDPTSTAALYSIWQQGVGRVNAPDAASADIQGEANAGMDIQADLSGSEHYEGYSYYDETAGKFRLRGEFADWDGGYWSWDGSYSPLSGGYGIWSGRYGIWSGRYGIWSGGYGIWSGKYGIWSGRYGIWSGRYGIWSGGYGIWSGGYGIWSGSEPWAGSVYAAPDFVQNFLAGLGPDASSTTTSIYWVDEP